MRTKFVEIREDEYLDLVGKADIARVMADAADANVKSAAWERMHHHSTISLLRLVIAESRSYLQTRTVQRIESHLRTIGHTSDIYRPPTNPQPEKDVESCPE